MPSAGVPQGPSADAPGPGGRRAAPRTVWVVRHAHAKADSPQGDVGRRLDHRGRAQAEHVGATLAGLVDRGELRRPELVTTSSAARARQTAEALADALGLGAPDVDTRFYLADADDLLSWVRGLDDELSTVALVGHNPAMGDLVELLVGPGAAAPGFPTAAVAVIEVGGAGWSAVAAGDGVLVHSVRA